MNLDHRNEGKHTDHLTTTTAPLVKFLLDNKNPGSGKSFKWEFLKDFKPAKPNFLSGGINLLNLDEAIKIANPEFIDVSSGIEEIRGLKSSKLIIEILQKIKSINLKN